MHDFVADGALGGLVANGTDQALRRPNYLVGGVTFGRALEAFRVPREVDYLSLDVEGAEHLVMHTFPWATHRINVLTVERPKPVLGAALRRHGYRHVCTHGPFGDELWVHAALARAAEVRAKLERVIACDDGGAPARPCAPIAYPKQAWCGSRASRHECREMQRQHGVRPYVEWGTLPREKQGRWTALRCDRFAVGAIL